MTCQCNALTYNTTNRLSYNTTYTSTTYVLHLYYNTTRAYAFLLYTITTDSCNVIQPHPVRKNRFRSRACARMCIIDPLHTMFSSFLIFDTVNDTVNLFWRIRHKKRGLKITLLICWVGSLRTFGSLPPLVFNVVHFLYKELWYLM